MRRERANHTLQSTALVREAYVRHVGQKADWQSRAHFFAIASKMTRRILVDRAQKTHAAKRGAGQTVGPLDEVAAVAGKSERQRVALDEAQTELEGSDPERGRMVELRFFGGLSNEEKSQILGISPATVQRKWNGAKARLYHELSRREA
jgi:RNA polymerase sigma-70 factor, ECF subfamily